MTIKREDKPHKHASTHTRGKSIDFSGMSKMTPDEIHHAKSIADVESDPFHDSSDKLNQIFELSAQGLSAKDIATKLRVREPTVVALLDKNATKYEKMKAKSHLKLKFVAEEENVYDQGRMNNLGKASNLLSEWDGKSLELLINDLQSGNLLRSYLTRDGQSATALPFESATEPPGGQLYAARPDHKESAPAFIERVYGEAGWLTGSFTRADLRKLDPAAMMGLSNWERGNGRAKLNLPTLKERTDQELSDPDHRQRARHGGRLNAALRRREP